MKRIDEKIKEIEKKDKSSRILYILFVGVIIAAMGIVLGLKKDIKERDIMLTETYKNLEEKKDSIAGAYEKLNNSLRPTDYWNYIKTENSNESYISYMTNDWTIKKPDSLLEKAIEKINLLEEDKDLKGWIYCGKTKGGVYSGYVDQGYYKGYLLNVVWRKGDTTVIKETEPQKNDVVQLLLPRNRITYRGSNLSSKNTEGWRPGTKAFVTDVERSGIETRIRVRYY